MSGARILAVPEDPKAWPEACLEATRVVRAGEVIVAATDTVYGVMADPFNPKAVERVFEAKKRRRDVALPVLVGSWAQADPLVESVPRQAAALVEAFWPGPLTLVLRRKSGLTWDLGAAGVTVGVRMPRDPFLLELLAVCGPLAATSANLSGEPTPRDCGQVAAALGDSVALYLDGGAREETTSTVVDLTGEYPKILRHGGIEAVDVFRVAGIGPLEPDGEPA
ncbi:MAG: L-threonylcarbamoyladenylate synthase [Actinomycetota bacterium]